MNGLRICIFVRQVYLQINRNPPPAFGFTIVASQETRR